MPELKAVYLYGSGVDDEFNDQSDVDLAFVASDEIPASDIWNLSGELASFLKRDVDLVNLKTTDTVHQLQIIEYGKLLYESEVFEKDWFELKILQAYLTLNDDRKEILEAIYDRKSVHG